MTLTQLPSVLRDWFEEIRTRAYTAARLIPNGGNLTTAQLDDMFEGMGAGYWMKNELPWVHIKNESSFVVEINQYTQKWLTDHPTFVVGMLSNYLQWFQNGMLMQASDLANLATQYVTLLNKIVGFTTFKVDDQFVDWRDQMWALTKEIYPAFPGGKTAPLFAAIDMLKGSIKMEFDQDQYDDLTDEERGEIGTLSVYLSLPSMGWPATVQSKFAVSTAANKIFYTGPDNSCELRHYGTSPFTDYFPTAFADGEVLTVARGVFAHTVRLHEIMTALTSISSYDEIKRSDNTVQILARHARWIRNLGTYYNPSDTLLIHPGIAI
jgi:hypothetical protein